MTSKQSFQEIMRKYDEIQAKNARHLANRHAEVIAKIPEYAEIEESIVDLSYEAAKSRVIDPSFDNASYHNKLQALSNKKKELLILNGFSSDYLDPIYDCPHCKDTGFIDSQQCSCLKQQLINIKYNESHIAEVLKYENFDTLSYDYYSPDEKICMDPIISAAKKFVDDFDNDFKNLFFTGSVGTGKTFISNCIAKELLDHGKSVMYFTSQGLVDTMSKVFKNNYSTEDNSVFDDIFNCDLLILDDLGTESYNSFTVERFFIVLNERLSRRKSTVISTNMDIQQIKDLYSERSISRILGSYDVFVFRGKDLRLNIRKSKA